MTSSVIDQARIAKTKKSDHQADQWAKLVTRVADGKVTSGVELSDRLDELDRSPDDLAAAVKQLEERRARQRTIGNEPKLQAELEAAEAEIESAKAAADEASRIARETFDRLGPAANSLRAQLSGIRSAKSELQRHCPDSVKRELDDLASRITELNQRRGRLEKLLRYPGRFVDKASPERRIESFAYRKRAAEAELRNISPKRTLDFAKREKNAKAALAAVAKERKAAQSEFDSLSSQLDGLQKSYSQLVERAIVA